MTFDNMIQILRDADALAVAVNHGEAEKLVQAAHAAAEKLATRETIIEDFKRDFHKDDSYSAMLVLELLEGEMND